MRVRRQSDRVGRKSERTLGACLPASVERGHGVEQEEQSTGAERLRGRQRERKAADREGWLAGRARLVLLLAYMLDRV